MKFVRHSAVFLLIAASLFAGCLAGDDPPEAENEEQGTGGTVQGTIFTIHLDVVANAPVVLVQGDEEVAQTQTDSEGTYRIENVEPGEYRFQVNAVCCRENVKMVEVVEGETVTVDLQLEIFSEDDLQVPRVERYEWRGFLACSVSTAVIGVNTCGIIDIVSDTAGQGNATDDDFLLRFEIGPGLQTLVGGLEWQAPGAALGDELVALLEVSGRPNDPPRWAREEGHSPLEWRAEAGYVLENYDEEIDGHNIHQYDFENVEESQEMMFRVFAGGAANLVYQQQFTLYWDLYYWDPAPEGATALPDI